MALMPVEQALSQLLADAVPPRRSERVALAQSLGRVAAAPVVASIPVPPLDNSAMDGYAVCSTGLGENAELHVTQRIAAGEVGSPLGVGEAARIFTGAPLPPGADAVVMQEECDRQGEWVRLQSRPQCGDHVRPAGQDVAPGQVLVSGGRRLRPADLGLLASVGVSEVSVYPRLRVAVLSTGDELVDPGTALGPGQIYNSNRPLLLALLRRLGCIAVDGGLVADTPEATVTALRAAAADADCVITSGGVSAGEEDHVRAALEREGQLRLWKLAIKPGKPLAYAFLDDTPVFGLPGNPASAFVTFCLLARPYLRRMEGDTQPLPQPWSVRAGFDWPRPGRRQEYLRVRLEVAADGVLEAQLYPNQSSGVLASVAWCNALAVIAPGVTLTAGDGVPVLPLAELEAL